MYHNQNNNNNQSNNVGNLSPHTITKRVNDIASILLQETNFETVLRILNKISQHPAMPPGLKNQK